MSKLSHNVISLPVPKSDASTDHGLIRNCVAYAKALGAFHEGSNADPDGNGAFSGGSPSFQRLESRARKLLTTIARTPATTANGLEAKARIVPMIMRDADGDFQDREQEFFGSFGAEVKAFLEEQQFDADARKYAAKAEAASPRGIERH